MKKTLLFFALIAVSCSSMMAHYKIGVYRDKFDKQTTIRMKRNVISAGGLLGTTFVELNAQRDQADNSMPSYSLYIRYNADDWLFIQSGESLVLLVDGIRLGLSGEGSSRYRQVGSLSRVSESAWYAITRGDLERIANASEVHLKLQGDPYFLEQKLSNKSIANLKRFMSEY